MNRQTHVSWGWVFLAALVVTGWHPAARALVYSPKITSEHVADCSSTEAFRQFPAWKDKQGQDLALAAWRYFVGTETGVFHGNAMREGSDPVSFEFRQIRDPIKMMNVYGYGYCGLFGPTTAGLFEGLGFKARALSIPGAAHCVTEVWYDNAWHYYDTDLRGVIFQRDGKIVASIQDILDDTALLTNPSRKFEPFFPGDRNDPGKYVKSYKEKPVDHLYHWQMGGTTMDYVLRKGESFTRWWKPQGGRWAFNKGDADDKFWRDLVERAPRGAKGNHPEFSIWTHGNGLFDYNPTLRKGSKDFEDGVFDQKNIVLTDKGLAPTGDAPAEVTWEVLSPYVIVPQVNSLDTTDDDREASVVTFDSTGPVAVSISLDYGRSYQEVKKVDSAGQTAIDLTPYLRSERYQYLIKFTLAPGKSATSLHSLRIKTWVQLAPASLPRLKKGLNHLQYAVDDKLGYNSVPWMEIPNMGDANEMSKWWSSKPTDYDPKRFSRRLKGEGQIVFKAPPGRQIQWMSLGGFFSSGQEKEAPKTHNEIWYALGDSDQWTLAYRADVPDWQQHWHYAYDQQVQLDQPADQVRVKYVGNPGVNGIRVNLHSIRPKEKPDTAVTVTHAFKMDGKLEQKKFVFEKPAAYTIDCPSDPEDISICLEVPSDNGGQGRQRETLTR